MLSGQSPCCRQRGSSSVHGHKRVSRDASSHERIQPLVVRIWIHCARGRECQESADFRHYRMDLQVHSPSNFCYHDRSVRSPCPNL